MPQSIETPQIFSTYEVAKLLGVDMTTVIGWCKQGKLSAYKTPGKHRRIKIDALLYFLNQYDMPVPASLQMQKDVLRCLVVDDEAAIRGLVKMALKDLDRSAQIEEAGDGFEAGRKLGELLPHLVILDLNLPGMDGFKVCKIIKADEKLKHTKILAISGFDTADTNKRILEAGADFFLPKPFKPQLLKEKAAQLLEKAGFYANSPSRK